MSIFTASSHFEYNYIDFYSVLPPKLFSSINISIYIQCPLCRASVTALLLCKQDASAPANVLTCELRRNVKICRRQSDFYNEVEREK
jgi:hypothetical protein